MIADVVKYAKRCKACQIHANFIHQPPELLYPTVTVWPFKTWGIDVIGPISPPSDRGHRFILVITDYFSKCAEVVPLAKVKMINIINFIKHQHPSIWCPLKDHPWQRSLICEQIILSVCDKYQIQNVTSIAYIPAANRLAEAFNKTIIKILKKFVFASKRDWNEKLSERLWFYRITVQTPTSNTPFFWCMSVKQSYPWRFRYHHFVLLWQPRWLTKTTISYISKNSKY